MVLLAACGKKKEPSVAPAQAPETVQSEGQPPATTAGNQPAAEVAPTEPDLEQLTRELRKWIVRNQRPPKSFEDFSATANIQIPTPPPGKKYAIDKQMHVVLVKR